MRRNKDTPAGNTVRKWLWLAGDGLGMRWPIASMWRVGE